MLLQLLLWVVEKSLLLSENTVIKKNVGTPRWKDRTWRGDLYAYVFDSAKTLALMDDFEGRGKTGDPFKRLMRKRYDQRKSY